MALNQCWILFVGQFRIWIHMLGLFYVHHPDLCESSTLTHTKNQSPQHGKWSPKNWFTFWEKPWEMMVNLAKNRPFSGKHLGISWKMGVAYFVIVRDIDGIFPEKLSIQLLGYPHDLGNPEGRTSEVPAASCNWITSSRVAAWLLTSWATEKNLW